MDNIKEEFLKINKISEEEYLDLNNKVLEDLRLKMLQAPSVNYAHSKQHIIQYFIGSITYFNGQDPWREPLFETGMNQYDQLLHLYIVKIRWSLYELIAQSEYKIEIFKILIDAHIEKLEKERITKIMDLNNLLKDS